MRNTIIKKVYSGHRHVGYIVGAVVDERLYGIGWSLCNRLDRFDKERGLMIALSRTNSTEINPPFSLVAKISDFSRRCDKYFKDKQAGQYA